MNSASGTFSVFARPGPVPVRLVQPVPGKTRASCDGKRGKRLLCSPNEDFGRGTKEELGIFEALFKGVSTQFGTRTIEKSFEKPECFFCQSLQNLRLGSINFVRKEKRLFDPVAWSRSIMLGFRQTHHLDRSCCVFDRHIIWLDHVVFDRHIFWLDHVVFSTDAP